MNHLEHNLLSAISRALRASHAPMRSAELYRLPEVQAHAPSGNSLSSCLDGLWRQGYLTRVLPAAVEMGGASWAYQWKGQGPSSLSSPAAVATEKDGASTVAKPRLVSSMPQRALRFDYLEGLKKGLQD